MKAIKATKKIGLCGTSLSINVTKECNALGIRRGDYVYITIEKAINNDQ